MSEAQPLHPSVDLLADLHAGESAEGLDQAFALSHLSGCTDCQSAVAPLDAVSTLLKTAEIAGPTELDWARMAQRARQQTVPAASKTPSKVAAIVRGQFSWRVVAAAAAVAALIPATLAWLLPPCQGTSGDMLSVSLTEDPGL